MFYIVVLFYIFIVLMSFISISFTRILELNDVQKCLILLLIVFWPITLVSFIIFIFLFSMLWIISTTLIPKGK